MSDQIEQIPKSKSKFSKSGIVIIIFIILIGIGLFFYISYLYPQKENTGAQKIGDSGYCRNMIFFTVKKAIYDNDAKSLIESYNAKIQSFSDQGNGSICIDQGNYTDLLNKLMTDSRFQNVQVKNNLMVPGNY